MTTWRNLWYLSDLVIGDCVRCVNGSMWRGYPRVSDLKNVDGLQGTVLYATDKSLIILVGGIIEYYIDHYNMPTRWEYIGTE